MPELFEKITDREYDSAEIIHHSILILKGIEVKKVRILIKTER